MDIIFWGLFTTNEGSVIISNKHGIYELPYELSINLILLGSKEIRTDQENLKTS